MVSSATNFSRSGVSDWIVQRISAAILALYTLTLFFFVLCQDQMTYDIWSNFFAWLPMKIFTLLAMLSLVGHAWVGLWTISTDYIKPLGLRFLFQAVVGLSSFVYLVWAIIILWG